MKEGLMHFTDTYLTSIGLVIFFLFFMGVLYWTSRKPNLQLYEQLKQLPLEGADHERR